MSNRSLASSTARVDIPSTTTAHRPSALSPTERARSVAAKLADRGRVVGALVVVLAGALLTGLVIVGLGLLLTHVLVPAGVDSLDASVTAWFVRHRTPSLDEVTWYTTQLGSTTVIVGLAGVSTVILAWRRLWADLVLLLGSLAAEFSVFLTATLLVDRTRPEVRRLDATPATSSYPSGHAAASIALYVSLAIILSAHVHSRVVRAVAWALAILIPISVALARLYRGMHHFTDVLASVLLGVAAVLIGAFAARVWTAIDEARAARSSQVRA